MYGAQMVRAGRRAHGPEAQPIRDRNMRLLGKYESLGILGRGGMGQVHAARPQDNPAVTVVVKVMRRELTDTPRARQIFDREVKYTTRLRHPYVVRILDAGVDPSAGPCIVMEFVPGVTLEQILAKEKRLATQRATWLAGCLCHALEAAHTAAVIHRDLKPANLMIVNAGTPQEHLKVMDFGLAQLSNKPFLSKEKFSGFKDVLTQGTPAYISPEQLRGDDVDARADLYSMGVVLFEALTGQLPFPQTKVDEVVAAHLRQPPPRFASLGVHDVPAAVEDIIQRCLAKFPPERPASAPVVAAELGKALGIDLWKDTTPLEEVRHSELPLAEEIPADPTADPNSLVKTAEAWMPDRIAIIKLGGFLQDLGGELLTSQPGLLQARFAPPGRQPGFFERILGGGKNKLDGIDLDLHLEKPDPKQSRLVVTAVFRVTGGGPPTNAGNWNGRCGRIYDMMKRYLMAGA
jgi:serine/threonine protein kinase